jgi:hypothetical protein
LQHQQQSLSLHVQGLFFLQAQIVVLKAMICDKSLPGVLSFVKHCRFSDLLKAKHFATLSGCLMNFQILFLVQSKR